MITGKIFLVHAGSNDNVSDTDNAYFDRVGLMVSAGEKAAFPNGQDSVALDAYYVEKTSSSITSLNIHSYPAVVVALDKYTPKVYLTEGARTESYLKSWFKNLFLGNVDANGVQGDSSWGSDIKLFDRNCNAVDKFLDFIKIGTIKRGVYGAGAIFLGYNAFNSPNSAGVALSGGMAAALAYLALGSPQSACAGTLTWDKDAKIILTGGGIALLMGGIWYLYLKDEIANRRLVRLVGAANQRNTTTVRKSANTPPRTKRTARPKSITKTVRYA